MQNPNERPDLVAGSSSAPTQSAASIAGAGAGNPPRLPPLTSLEFGQSKFSLDTADEHPVLEASEVPLSPAKPHRLSWWPRGRQAEESGAGVPPNPVVNELDDGPQGVPGCFGCLPPSSKHHEDAHKKTGKKRPQRDSVLLGDTRTDRSERGLPLPSDEKQSRRRSLLSALPMIGQSFAGGNTVSADRAAAPLPAETDKNQTEEVQNGR